MESVRNTDKNINEFDDYKIIEYLKNFVYSESIDKFNYIVKTNEDYLKLTNNCCERFFKYLKGEAMSSGYTFEEAILVRMYLDLVGFFKTVKCSLKNKYDNSKAKLGLLVKRYINKININENFHICQKKSKKDKNFNKSSKKTNISKSNIVIESEFEENTINKKNYTRSMNCLRNTFNNNKTYSDLYKSECINYIGKNLLSNIKTEDLLKKANEDIKEKKERIKTQNVSIFQKDRKIDEKDQIIKERDQILKEKDQTIKEKDQTIKEKDQINKKKDQIIINIYNKSEIERKNTLYLLSKITNLENELKKLKRE